MVASYPDLVERWRRQQSEIVSTTPPARRWRAQLLAQGAEGVGGTPESLGQVVTAELPKWAKLAKDANIKAD